MSLGTERGGNPVCVYSFRQDFSDTKETEDGAVCVYTLTPACYLLAAVSGSWLPEEQCSVSAHCPSLCPKADAGLMPIPTIDA